LYLVSANLGAQVAPNIVVVMADDMGVGDASPYLGKRLGPNAPKITKTLATPNLDRLAAQGMIFTDVHTASVTCTPSRYGLLTGRYPWRTYNKHKVIGSWASPPMIAPGRPTLATLLKQNGYRTAAFGKWHIGLTFMDDKGQPITFKRGDEFNWSKVQSGHAAGGGYLQSIYDGPLSHGFDEFFGLGGNFYLDEGSSLKAYIKNNSFVGIPAWKGAPGADSAGPGVADWDEERIGEQYLNNALDFIDRQLEGEDYQPFFIYYAPNANHVPHSPAEQIVVQGQTIPIRNQARFSNGKDASEREDMVYENDVTVGLMLDKLATQNDPRTGRPLLESTLFIFTSDNGADPGIGSSAHAGLTGKKGALYEGGHRVPFIVAWPDGDIPGGALSRALFGQVDLYASFAELLGHTLQLDEAEDSANVLPALLGQVPGTEFQRSHSLVVHDDRHVKNDLPDDSLMLIRDQSAALMINGKLINRNRINDTSRGQAEPIRFYDLDTDLYQQNDLRQAPAHQARVNALSERLLRFHNQGYSRPLNHQALTGSEQLLLSDGGIELRNNRSGSIGYEFTVGSQPMSLQSLGMWDDGAADVIVKEDDNSSDGQTSGIPDGLAADHVVRLFDGATRELLASVVVTNGNSYIEGEFRYVDLPQAVSLAAGQTYALTVDTTPDDRDLFHHFAAYTAVSPTPTGRVGNFTARIANNAAAYPGLYPDGADGRYNRHPDMFRHRMFVGPNARLATALVDPEGMPKFDARTDRAIFLWRDADHAWHLRGAGGGRLVEYVGSITADQSFSVVQPYSLEHTDIVDTSDPDSIQFRLVTTTGQDGMDFAVPAGTSICVAVESPEDVRVLVGSARVPVAVPLNLADFGPCEAAASAADSDGAPAYDPAADKAVYLWREPDRTWRLRATGGGSWTKYVGTLTATQPFTYVQKNDLEKRDVLDSSQPNIVAFELAMANSGEDGIDFAIPEGSNACLDVQMPASASVRVGADLIKVTPPFNLADLGPCD